MPSQKEEFDRDLLAQMKREELPRLLQRAKQMEEEAAASRQKLAERAPRVTGTWVDDTIPPGQQQMLTEDMLKQMVRDLKHQRPTPYPTQILVNPLMAQQMVAGGLSPRHGALGSAASPQSNALADQPEPTRQPFPYQRAGADHLIANPRAALVDDPGLGKTFQTLLAAWHVRAKRMLIVCPAIAVQAWKRELADLFPGVQPTFVHSGMNAVPDYTYDGVYIVTYDLLGQEKNVHVRKAIGADIWDVLVADEAHYLKNMDANRTKAFYGVGRESAKWPGIHARHRWLLSGTLAPNHVGELYPHMENLWHVQRDEVFKELGRASLVAGKVSQETWEDLTCNVRTINVSNQQRRQISGSKPEAVQVLAKHLRPVSLRRRKEDVLKDLPSLRITDEPLNLTGDVLPDWFRSMGKPSSGIHPGDTDDSLLATLHALSSSTGFHNADNASNARRILGEQKVDASVQYARDFLDSAPGKKLIIFAYHKSVIETLGHKLIDYKPVVITGDTPQKVREDVVTAFQDPNSGARIFIGQIVAAGTAITLTAASDVLVVEPSWVPAENYQAICRAHRIGQKDGVHARFLYVPDSMDERIMKAFRRKAQQLAPLF